MIYAELAGGLGNQMFIYAFARALGLRCGEPVTLLDRQDWRDGAPAHTVCALDELNISPDVKIIADAGFAKAHLPRRNAAKALMIKYEQRRGLMAREEYNLPLSAEAYAHLLPKIDGCLIAKTRYLIPLDNGLTAELDHFKSPLSGLYLVEVEFPDIAGADAFVPPSWFGQEVTENPFYHNSAMSRLDPSTSAASSRPPRG